MASTPASTEKSRSRPPWKTNKMIPPDAKCGVHKTVNSHSFGVVCYAWNLLSLWESCRRSRLRGKNMTIPKDNSQLENARRLRREMTPRERKLWYLSLRKYPVKIYKQRIIGRFIVDFYCASAKLVIELDGSQHYEPQGMVYDSERSAFLTALGLKVLRFSNRDVDRDFRGVCTQIDITIQKRLQGPLSHLR